MAVEIDPHPSLSEPRAEVAGQIVEGVRVLLEPAPIGRRLMALAIDFGVIATVFYAAMISLVLLTMPFLVGSAAALKGGSKAGAALLAAIFVIGFLAVMLGLVFGWHYYFIRFEGRTGATPGKRLMGLRVVNLNGGPITRGQAIYRELTRSYLDMLILPSALAMLLSKRRQRVGDLLAGTMVVYSKAKDDEPGFVYVKRADFLALRAHLDPAPVPQDVVEGYLRFAYQAFSLGRGLQMGTEAEAWLPAVRSHLARSEEIGLNDQTVLRFFAELCFQQTRNSAAHAPQTKG